MIHISAVFKGAQPSLGYQPGERYELVVSGRVIRDADGVGQPCPYGSVAQAMIGWTYRR